MRAALRLATVVATILVLVVGVMPAAARPAKNLRERHGRASRVTSSRIDAADFGLEVIGDHGLSKRDQAETGRTQEEAAAVSRSRARATSDIIADIFEVARLGPLPADDRHYESVSQSPIRTRPLTPSSDRAPPVVQ